MKSEWEIVIAEKFCSSVRDGTHDSPKRVDLHDSRYLITSKHLQDYRIDFDNAYKISTLDYCKIMERSKVDQWDILFSMIGTIGKTYQEKNKNPNYAIKNVGLFKMDGNRQKSEWLKYYLQSPTAKAYIQSQLRGSTQSYVPLGALRKMPIMCPPPEEQRAITTTLSCLDSKIELNNKISANLEAQIQAIFKSWFVDFGPFQDGDFVDSELGMIPKGWLVKPLEDVANYVKERIAINQCNIQNYISTENMLANKQGIVFASSLPNTTTVSRYESQDILISNIRPYFKKIWFSDKVGGCSNDVLVMRAKYKILNGFIYSLLYSDTFFGYMTATSKGTKMPRGDKSAIMQYFVALPESFENDIYIKEFNDIVLSFQKKIQILRKENCVLETLRDTLLPKLMSGEIEVLVN